ncbi:MAG: hypothetical protein KIT84_19715 [Labilithrix sp.]|nr:hypothetical protein [Labilithrix sp.]MCW5813265.1 hypothetical protein [Labilithrix sp.]
MSSFAVPLWAWGLFAAVVVASLAIDLIQHRGDHADSRRRALIWSGIWIGVSLLFAGFVALQLGAPAAQEFVTAWLVEKSLSVDNLFVFLVIFRRLRVPREQQHKVLFWGIIGAFVTRGLFIAAGSAVLERWHAATYVLGAFLVFTGLKTLGHGREARDEKESKVVTFAQRYVSAPLLVPIVAIELSDIMFAIDSIPAVFAISRDPFIVFTSNVFAILGLRALYLVLADVVANLKYLHYGLGTLLVFVGAKMIAGHWVHVPNWASLATTVAILTAAVVPSLVHRRRVEATGTS